MAILFVTLALCLGGAYVALRMPSSVFPQADFPRVVILVDNGVMPADEMMATITRPIEEAMKDVPGAVSVTSTTGRGAAEVNVLFDWNANMVQSELYVNSRLAQIRSSIPATAEATVWRLTFSAFPIIGVSLTSSTRGTVSLWELAHYEIKPRFLRIPGVARVDIVGGRAPEYHIVVDPLRLSAAGLRLSDVKSAFAVNNLVAPTGLHEEHDTLYLTVVDGRVHSIADIEDTVITVKGGRAIPVREFASVERGPEPAFAVVTADGVDAVLLNIRSQPDGSTLDISDRVKAELRQIQSDVPPDVRTAFFYDQSLLVRASVQSVWEAIGFGLVLSTVIIYCFLKNWSTTSTAIVVIPATVLITLLAMSTARMSFDLMTLGGIAAAIGLVIDDAIVVVEAIHAEMKRGVPRLQAVQDAVGEIFAPLAGSTLTPVVVFLPLAFLDGIPGVFFRALALTMVVALLTSLIMAVTLTPALAATFIRVPAGTPSGEAEGTEGFILRRVIYVYETALRGALKLKWLTLCACIAVLATGAWMSTKLESEFLPAMDEGGFVIDYHTPWGTSLGETNRQLLVAEDLLRATPEVESYSRRTGARLALAIAEPNTGDYLVKLRSDRRRSTKEVISELRTRLAVAVPGAMWEFPGILADLIGDLTMSPKEIEVKLYSKDLSFLIRKAPEIEQRLKSVRGVVDTSDGIVYTGPTLSFRVRHPDAERFGLSTTDLASEVGIAMLGETATSVLEGDRSAMIRVGMDATQSDRIANMGELLVRAKDAAPVKLSQVADLVEEPGQPELRREDLRQMVAVSARLEGRDLGSAMTEIRAGISGDPTLPPGSVEFGGLYHQQQESFRNLLLVLAMAILLVFTVLLVEFRSFSAPIAIVFGAVLAMFGTVLALWVTGITLNIVSFLGAIIGVGVVAKNGILMLDLVDRLRAEGFDLVEALVLSGRRRLRPVLMTSMAAAIGMLPLAYGIGAGADMLKPLAVAVIGALCISVLLSLVATPTIYALLLSSCQTRVQPAAAASLQAVR